MIRAGLPFGDVLLILVFLWMFFAVIIGVYTTKLKGKHLKIALRALGAAVTSLVFVIVVINLIALLFN
ncbi:MAG: hypothetical protein Q8O92_03435 [Candidatus Latescibacter sp.]|nr:hypothetical protein [Candidatus Latescibacter sp.]